MTGEAVVSPKKERRRRSTNVFSSDWFIYSISLSGGKTETYC